MKNFFLLAISILSMQLIWGQQSSINLKSDIQTTDPVEVKPEFPGGINEFYKFIMQNYKLPLSKDFLGGKVYVAFIIEKDGRLTEIKILKDIGFGTGEEAIRVLKLSPIWTPAEQNGNKVRCSYTLPIALQGYVFKASEVEIKPVFLGGVEKLYEFVSKNYKIPEIEGLKGTVYVRVTVEKDGSLTDIKVLKDIGFGTGDEAVRVLKLSPNWVPAQHKGQAVRCAYFLPISLQSR